MQLAPAAEWTESRRTPVLARDIVKSAVAASAKMIRRQDSAARAEEHETLQSTIPGLCFSLVTTAAACVVINHARGVEGTATFISCYLMELSLSMDNMFAFYLIFKFFKCPVELQAVALGWGIAGAILLRAAALVVGVVAVSTVKPLLLLFAAALFWSAVKVAVSGDDDDDEDLADNRVVRCVTAIVPVTEGYHEGKLLAREDGKLRATPLLLVLIVIELSDIVFALDSVPAVLGMSSDTLIVYLAVMCAVTSLRSVYAVTVVLIKRFVYLPLAVGLLLGFIGVKIVLDVIFGLVVPVWLSLAMIMCTLAGGIGASLIWGPPAAGPGDIYASVPVGTADALEEGSLLRSTDDAYSGLVAGRASGVPGALSGAETPVLAHGQMERARLASVAADADAVADLPGAGGRGSPGAKHGSGGSHESEPRKRGGSSNGGVVVE